MIRAKYQKGRRREKPSLGVLGATLSDEDLPYGDLQRSNTLRQPLLLHIVLLGLYLEAVTLFRVSQRLYTSWEKGVRIPRKGRSLAEGLRLSR